MKDQYDGQMRKMYPCDYTEGQSRGAYKNPALGASQESVRAEQTRFATKPMSKKVSGQFRADK